MYGVFRVCTGPTAKTSPRETSLAGVSRRPKQLCPCQSCPLRNFFSARAVSLLFCLTAWRILDQAPLGQKTTHSRLSSGMQVASRELLESAAEFLWSEELQDRFDAFAAAHSALFVGASPDGEQRLEWQGVYESFRGLFEAELEGFLGRNLVTMEDFVLACQDALDNSDWIHGKGLVEVVLAASEYKFFINMMIGAAEEAAQLVLPDEAWAGGVGDGPGLVDEDAADGRVTPPTSGVAGTDDMDAFT